MPSFEFVIPDSFLFIPANLSFISFCIFVSFMMSRILKSSIVFFVVLVSLLSIAYYDIFVKFIIKNYYEITQMDSKIYSSINKNNENKIESLSLVGVYAYPLKYSTSLSLVEEKQIAKVHEQYVEKFIDISTYANRFNKYIYGTQRVYLNSYKYTNNSINNKNEKPSFIVSKALKKTFLPDFIKKEEFKFLDKNTNIIVATAFKLSFLIDTNKFRNKYLYWSLEKEEDFNLPLIQNFDNIYKKVFIDIK